MSTLASVILYDVVGSRPSASIEGRLFFATDTLIMYRDNGSSWDAVSPVFPADATQFLNGTGAFSVPAGGGGGGAGPVFSPDTPPVSAGSFDDEFPGTSLSGSWTTVGSPTIAVKNSFVEVVDAVHSGNSVKHIYQTAPSPTWEMTAKISVLGKFIDFLLGGISISDSSGKLITLCLTRDNGSFGAVPAVVVVRYNSVTSFDSYQVGYNNCSTSIYLKIKDDGTNLTYSFSWDGVHFMPILVEGRTAWLASGPTRIGICVDTNTTGKDGAVTCDWFRRTL